MHFGELGWGFREFGVSNNGWFSKLWLLGALTFCLCFGCWSTYISMIINCEHNLHLEKKKGGGGDKMNNGKKIPLDVGFKII